jgi:hypothetical protein
VIGQISEFILYALILSWTYNRGYRDGQRSRSGFER